MKLTVLSMLTLSIIALLVATVYQDYRRFHKPLLTTPYQAVTLISGDTYYGRIDHLGTDHPVLRDALSLRQEVDLANQKLRYIVKRRADEANGADHMIFTSNAILYIEPVHRDSIIGRVISEANPR